MSFFFPDPTDEITAIPANQRTTAQQMFLDLTPLTFSLAPEVKSELHSLRDRGSKILMPAAETAAALFESFAPRLDLNPAGTHRRPLAEFSIINPKPKEQRDNYDPAGWSWRVSCSVTIERLPQRRCEYYDVQPTAELLTAIGCNMLPIENDTISLSVIVRENGSAWVYSSYGRIIGGRTIAIINAATLPAPAALS